MADDYVSWTATWRGGLAVDVAGGEYQYRVDEPESLGGTGTGPMPTEMLMVALASCFCLSVAWAAGKRRVELGELSVQVRGDQAHGEPRIGRYEILVRSDVAKDVMAPVVELGARYCWVSNTLRNPPEIVHAIDEVAPLPSQE